MNDAERERGEPGAVIPPAAEPWLVPMRLDGKVALVTGAARGQGRSHALHLAAAGADIIAVDLASQLDTVTYPMATKADLKETAEAIRGLGRRVYARAGDVRDEARLADIVGEGVRELGRLDIAVANAGISGYAGVGAMSAEAWNTMLAVNLTGAWQTANVAIPHIDAGGQGGSVVFISSVGGLRGIRNLVHYTATKHAVVGMMRTLALEWAPKSIRVNSVHPTAVRTAMIMNPVTFGLFRPDLAEPTIDDVRDAFQANNALPVPWVEPADISRAVLFLVSDAGRYITGVTLPVDAGALLK